jgi:hypothetical protein
MERLTTMMNLNDTPSGGPLTAADLARYRALHRPYIPSGCDQQGRHPQAAEACTDMGVSDDALAAASGIVRALLWSLAIYAAGIATWMALS